MKIRPHLLAVIAFVVALGTSARSEDEKQYLGAFSNVIISSMSGDCDGISMKLWKSRDSEGKRRITGFYYDASSTCRGEPVPISDVSYDEGTETVDLQAKDNESGLVVAEFKGKITQAYLLGTFGFGNLGTKEVGSGWQVKLRRLNSKDWKRVGGK